MTTAAPPFPRIAVVIPTFGQMDYVRATLESLQRTSPWITRIVVDDASPDWDPSVINPVEGHNVVHRFATRDGLTRSWNFGAALAQDTGDSDYIVLGNSDIIAGANWWQGMVEALAADRHPFVGPMTNAPGSTRNNRQDVRRIWSEYQPSDEQSRVDHAVTRLYRQYGDRAEACDINGFFMMGKTKAFKAFAYSKNFFLPPRIFKMPSGRDNPTPHLTGQEDWINAKVKAAGYNNAAALGSFIFHYRSVSRGEAFARLTAGAAYRRSA